MKHGDGGLLSFWSITIGSFFLTSSCFCEKRRGTGLVNVQQIVPPCCGSGISSLFQLGSLTSSSEKNMSLFRKGTYNSGFFEKRQNLHPGELCWNLSAYVREYSSGISNLFN